MTRLIDFTWGHANRGGHHDWPFLMALKQGFFVSGLPINFTGGAL